MYHKMNYWQKRSFWQSLSLQFVFERVPNKSGRRVIPPSEWSDRMISISGKCLFGRLSTRDIKAIEDTIQEMGSVSDSFPRTVDLSKQRAFSCKLIQPENKKEHSGVFCELSVIYGHSGMGLHTDAQKN